MAKVATFRQFFTSRPVGVAAMVAALLLLQGFYIGGAFFRNPPFIGYYTGVAYLGNGGVQYNSCYAPTEAMMNDESVAAKGAYASNTGSGGTIRADLGSIKLVSRIRIGGHGPNTGGTPNCWYTEPSIYWSTAVIFEISTDCSSYSTVATGANITYSDTVMQNLDITPVMARCVRMRHPSNWLGTGQFRIGNF